MVTNEELVEALTDHWTMLMANSRMLHELTHQAPLDFTDSFRTCPRRPCRRAHKVGAVADRMLGLQAKADVLHAEMNAALHAFAETLPDDDEPVS